MRRRSAFERDFADLHGEPNLLEMEPVGPSTYRPAKGRPWRDPMPGASPLMRLCVGAVLVVWIAFLFVLCAIGIGAVIFLVWALFH